MTVPIGLSTAFWNSRYWLTGIHILFLLALAFLFALIALVFALLFHSPGLFFSITKGYWHIPAGLFVVAALLAYWMSSQKPFDPTRSEPAGDNNKTCQGLLESLCIAAGLPRVPELYIVDHQSVNGVIWGNRIDSLRMYVTKGACEKLKKEALEALMAQQIGRLVNGDPFIYPFMTMFIRMVCFTTLGFLENILGWRGSLSGDDSEENEDNQVLNIARAGSKFPPLLAFLLIFPALWFVFRQYGAHYGQMCEFRADLYAIRLTKNAHALLEAFEAVNPNDRLFAFPDDWKELAFVNPDPVMTLPWHSDTDERLIKLREVIGLASFEHRKN